MRSGWLVAGLLVVTMLALVPGTTTGGLPPCEAAVQMHCMHEHPDGRDIHCVHYVGLGSTHVNDCVHVPL